MIRIMVGFILGIVTTIYFYPHVSDVYQKFSSAIFPTNSKTTHSSNIINSEPPTSYGVDNKNISSEILTALTLTKTRNLDESTTDFVIKTIAKLVQNEPLLKDFVAQKLENGITNKEALEIFEHYYLIKG